MKFLHICRILFTMLLLTQGTACFKKEMEKSPDSNQLTIKTIADAQSVLDNTSVMKESSLLKDISVEEIYLPDDTAWQIQNPLEHRAFIWETDIYQGRNDVGDWIKLYRIVFYANTVLFALPAIQREHEQVTIDRLTGSALFQRAYIFYDLAQQFSPPYDSLTAATDAGIPLRLTTDENEPSHRASVSETYQRIIADAKEACRLLPASIDQKRKNRPTRPAAYALLARVYMSMRAYTEACAYADSCLRLYAVLINYDDALMVMENPFMRTHAEIMYNSNVLSTNVMFKRNDLYINPELYGLYHPDDLRLDVLYKKTPAGLPVPNQDYTGNVYCFTGLATDEMFLIRAECYARKGDVAAALKDLNTLLITRWRKGTYIPYTAGSAADALEIILTERRKAFIFRGLRWTDIRRLNKEDRRITLHRVQNGISYFLYPNDKRYVLPIPPNVIRLSGLPDNDRQ